ncbi:MAG: SHOCT-like domain-containing protein [Dehalococcoidia bacterium]
MNEERMRILELLEKGQINAQEAAELLKAVGTNGSRQEEARQDRGRWFRIRITDSSTGRERANFAIPLAMLSFPFGMASGFGMWKTRGKMDEILEAVRSGRRGTLFDIKGGDAERIEIIVD